jgi:hypothetical protein
VAAETRFRSTPFDYAWQVIVDEGMNTVSYELNEALIAFGSAIDKGNLDGACSMLEALCGEISPHSPLSMLSEFVTGPTLSFVFSFTSYWAHLLRLGISGSLRPKLSPCGINSHCLLCNERILLLLSAALVQLATFPRCGCSAHWHIRFFLNELSAGRDVICRHGICIK